MIKIRRYIDKDKDAWNKFNNESKNKLFMFDRNYMDYHRDRFADYSLMFYKDENLIALFPACKIDGVIISHSGLTFGGFITNDKMKQHTMNECFDELLQYANHFGIQKVIYKSIPHIYHIQPAEEDRFSLFSNSARLAAVDVSTYVNLSSPLKKSKGRKAQISRAKREGVAINILTEQSDYDKFIELENTVLESRHGTHAVHTSQELKLLHDRFPKNIHLFGAERDGKLIAGTVVFEYENVVHTQYMAANDEARQVGALDLAIATVIEKYKENKAWLDFGISTEHGKLYLNEGLAAQKESFGGRTGVYEIWELEI